VGSRHEQCHTDGEEDTRASLNEEQDLVLANRTVLDAPDTETDETAKRAG